MDFSFPYEPYEIQQQLMSNLYSSFQNGKISIVESPTGTGKSLSIICSLTKWLEDYKSDQVAQLTKKIDELKMSSKTVGEDQSSKQTDDWLSAQLKQISTKNEINDLNSKLEQLTKHVTRTKQLKKNSKLKNMDNKKLINNPSNKRSIENVDDDQSEDYELIVQFDENQIIDFDEDCQKDDDYFRPKIFYCSRTHSQLSQFINEFKKTKYYRNYPSSMMMIPLSSRMNYCINPNVNHFTNLMMINEKCNDLKQSGGNKKCPMYNRSKMEELGEQILSDVFDLEEIVNIGKQKQACPYFSTRLTIPESEILVMPYNILLNKSTREYFGIHLKDSVVIIDEAHNLLETIANVHSVEIKSSQLTNLLKFVSMYMAKYNNRFNAQNLLYLKQLVFVTKRMSTLLSTTKQNACYDPLDLTLKLSIENINIPKLLRFIDQSRISSKLHMFSTKKHLDKTNSEKIQKTTKTLEPLNKVNLNKNQLNCKLIKENNVLTTNHEDEFFTSNTLNSIKDFLESLNNFDVDAKILMTIDQNDQNNSSFKYVLLSTSSHFKDILQECRSVILCGGTMKPFEDYIHQLFEPLKIPRERTTFHSYNHVISDDKLIAIGLGRGPRNNVLNFSYNTRNCPKVIDETGQLLVKLVDCIPKGIVIFFPSYEYQEFILKQWEKLGVLRQFEKQKKRIFKEPKKSSLVQTVLNSYSKFIKSNKENSAILFSVIGGKMSEGINFSDDLGRGIIVIGLPYANRNSIELNEKINYLNRIKDNAGNEYYENLCMRAVNQAIGRAIRHRNDYAAIILLDERYQKPTVNQKLSDWIRTRFTMKNDFNQAQFQLKEFFQIKMFN